MLRAIFEPLECVGYTVPYLRQKRGFQIPCTPCTPAAQYGPEHGSPTWVIVLSSNTNNAAQLACQYRLGRSQGRLGKCKQPTLCATQGLSLARSPDDMLACWRRRDVSELVLTYVMNDIPARSPRSTMEDSQVSFGCIDGCRKTSLIKNAVNDRGSVALPATAQASHRTRPWPRSHPLDA